MRLVLCAAGLAVLVACHAPKREPRGTEPPSAEALGRFRMASGSGWKTPPPPSRITAEGTVPDRSAEASADPVDGRAPAGPDVHGPSILGRAETEASRRSAMMLGSNPLSLEDVLLSVESQFPLVLAAMEQIEIARGGLVASEGAFDTKLEAGTFQEVEGFYDGDEYDVKIEQPTTLWGLAVTGGWRRGEGSFADYDGKRKTNTDGEFKLGVRLPLLQGGRVDEMRVAMWKARLAQDAAEPAILRKRLEATRKAAESYWKWVAMGGKYAIGLRLLEIAETRQDQVRRSVDAGKLAPIDVVDNQRIIVDRQAKLAKIERGLQQAAILLSLYWRGPDGEPIVPGPEHLPDGFPEPADPELTFFPDDEALAVSRRPELQELSLAREALRLEGELFDNELLPRLDLGVSASQDYGDAVNTPDDKGDFELEASLRFQLPLQRRKPKGKLLANVAKRAKLDQELRFLQDVVVSEVRDAESALRQTWVRIEQARQNVDLARRLEEAERIQFGVGDSDLFRVNAREKQSAEASASLVDVLAEHFRSLVAYRAVLGLPYDEVLAGQPVGGDVVEQAPVGGPDDEP